MTQWILRIFLVTVAGFVLRLSTIGKNKSGAEAALRFLSSLVLVLAVIGPFFEKLPQRIEIPKNYFSQGDVTDGAALLLEKSLITMKEAAAAAFPETSFSLEAETSEDGALTTVKLICEAEEGPLVADFIKTKYAIPCVVEERS